MGRGTCTFNRLVTHVGMLLISDAVVFFGVRVGQSLGPGMLGQSSCKLGQ